jgi:hypothetical protein
MFVTIFYGENGFLLLSTNNTNFLVLLLTL